ncbi:MAG: hypothetical protein ACRDG8_03815 [Actinomycetota bacterium]
MNEPWLRGMQQIEDVPPPSGLLERAKETAPHRPPTPSWPSSRALVLVIGLSIAVAGIAVAFVAFVSDGDSRTAGGTYADPTHGWTIDVPSGMDLVPIETEGRVVVTGAVISNSPIEHPESLSELQDFAPESVVLRIWHNEGGLLFPISEDDASFPISIGDLHLVKPYVGGSEPRPLYTSFFARGTDFNVAIWFGAEASDEARTAISEALSTLRFPPTEPGTVLNDRMIVLDNASSYAVGSATRYDRAELPLDTGRFADYKGPFSFYLVHAPNGFYAISTDFLGNRQRCDLQLDRPSMTFSCPGTGWGWDRAGRAFSRGKPWPDGVDDLLVLPAPTSWDGHIMIDPFGNSPDSALGAWSSDPTCQGAIDLRPTYLPWVQGQIPAPRQTYDATIDRDQLSWTAPDGTGVGLTLYPHVPQGNVGEETVILVDGVAGQLHRQDEGGLVGLSWDLRGRRCNYLELVISRPDGTKAEAIEELLRIAASLRPAA